MRRYLAVSLTVRRLCIGENHQLAGKWARHFAQLSIINSRIDVNLSLGRPAKATLLRDSFAGNCRSFAWSSRTRGRHSRLANTGREGDYSNFDERFVFQAVFATAISNRVYRSQFQSARGA